MCVWSQGWLRAELLARLVGSGIQNLFLYEACDGSLQQVTQEMARGIDLNVFLGEFPCCTVRHCGHLRCDREKLRTPMLGIFAHYVRDRIRQQAATTEEATACLLSTELIEHDRDRMFSRFFQFQTATSSCEVRELFGPLLEMVEQRIRASGQAHNELMTMCAVGTAGVDGVHERECTVTRSSDLSQEISSCDEDDNLVEGRTHVVEQEVEEEEGEVVDCDVPSEILSKGGQATSSTHQPVRKQGSPREGKRLQDERGVGSNKSIEVKSADAAHVTLDVTEDFTESELL